MQQNDDIISVDTLTAPVVEAQHQLVYKPLRKLSLTGNFDGDGKTDTLLQDNISRRINSAIDTFPDPFNNEWDSVVDFFYREESDVVLALKNRKSDTLHLGTGMGPYCLINIGDNNKDGREEIALVPDLLDQSRVNSCVVYSLCQGKWQELMRFGIHEDAFNFTTDTIPVFNEIESFLEKKNGRWMYFDYNSYAQNDSSELGMKPLKIDRCK
jgi:hypothetical protein